ncbi:F-box/leucine-rich repeat protein [Klosneuvirus KNV1]|uniref:F-box/leucine-rich repeat protein n=1 Tax=Klosneuvirus KNV1 TaxID=1977640 RepID=A0A1V0SI33_9VIRU|nr:F-box/leucine-rich repeat protein [Klosneuvirus KNV1]
MIDDVIFLIFPYLDLQDRYSYALSCLQYYQIFNHESLWKQYLEQSINNDTIKNIWNENYKSTYKRYHKLTILKSQLNLHIIIDELTSLTTLNLGYKNLKILPKQITELMNLKLLDLQDNQLTTIPKELCQLANLEWLNVANNQLITLPSELSKLTNLKILYVYQNPPLHIPDDILLLPKLKIKNQYLVG